MRISATLANEGRVLVALAVSFVVVVLLLLFVPSKPLSTNSVAAAFTNALTHLAPAVRRVVVYGHPDPEKLQVVLACAFSLSMPLLALIWGTGSKYAKGQWVSRWRGAAEIILLCLLIAYLLYWPAHSLSAPWQELGAPTDARRRLFWSNTSLLLSCPLLSVGLALFVEALASNLREARRHHRIKVVA